MIIVLKANRSEEQVKNFISNLTDRYDVSVNTWVGTHSTVLGLIGDTAAVLRMRKAISSRPIP